MKTPTMASGFLFYKGLLIKKFAAKVDQKTTWKRQKIDNSALGLEAFTFLI